MLFLIILILSFASGFFLPWWVGTVIAFAAALYAGKTTGQAFWSGFFAMIIVWGALALFKTIPNDHILATKVAVLFHLPGWGYLLFISCLIGGIVGGMAALSGILIKKCFFIKE